METMYSQLFHWTLLLLWGTLDIQVASGLTCPKQCNCTQAPNGLTDISCKISSYQGGLKANSFTNLHGINSLHISGVIGVIDRGAFNGISGNQNSSVVSLQSWNVTSITRYAFSNVYNLLRFEIGYSKIETLDTEAFFNSTVSEIQMHHTSIKTVKGYSFRTTQVVRFNFSYCDFGSLDISAFADMEGVKDIYFGYSDIHLIKEYCFKGVKHGERIIFTYSSISLVEKYAFELMSFSLFEISYCDVLHMEPLVFLRSADIQKVKISHSDFIFVSDFAFYGMQNIDKFELEYTEVLCAGNRALSGFYFEQDRFNHFPVRQVLDVRPMGEIKTMYKCIGFDLASFLERFTVPQGEDVLDVTNSKTSPELTDSVTPSITKLTTPNGPLETTTTLISKEDGKCAHVLILEMVVGVLGLLLVILVITLVVIVRRLKNTTRELKNCSSASEMTPPSKTDCTSETAARLNISEVFTPISKANGGQGINH